MVASSGNVADMVTGGGSPQSLEPLNGPVLGGGVWSYLFPDERQHHAREAHVKVNNTCKGKYRIRSQGAACHGRACCEGD